MVEEYEVEERNGQTALPSTSTARQIRNRRIASERYNVASRYGGSNSPPPLSHVPNTPSSPPGSPKIFTGRRSQDIPLHSEKFNASKYQIPTSPQKSTNGVSFNRLSPILSNRSKPPMVAQSTPQSPSKSWDEGDEHPYKSRSRQSQAFGIHTRLPHQQPIPLTQVQSDVTGSSSLRPKYNLNPRIQGSSNQIRSICRDANPFAELILDEGDSRSIDSLNDPDLCLDILKRPVKSSWLCAEQRPPTPTNTTGTGCTSLTTATLAEDDVSSLGGVEDCFASSCSSIARILLAIKNNAARPSHLSLEEKALWDAVQAVKRQARQDGMATVDTRSSCSRCNTPTHSSVGNLEPISPPQAQPVSVLTDFWELHCHETQELAIKQQRENSRSLRAIQRVLADVQAERDKAVGQLNDLRQNGSVNFNIESCPSDDMDSAADRNSLEMETLKMKLSASNLRIERLEQELIASRAARTAIGEILVPSFVSEEHVGIPKVMDSDQWHEALSNDSNAKSSELLETESMDFIPGLRKELSDKSSALENAKMIIASLENASSTFSAEMRSKLKAKEDDYTKLKKESIEKQKTLDAIATELRDLQRLKVQSLSCSSSERSRRLALSSRLEKNMADIRAASVVLEATHDPATIQTVESRLFDSISAIKEGIDVIDDFENEECIIDISSGVNNFDFSQSFRLTAEQTRLLRELDDQKKLSKQLEENLRKYKDELKRTRTQFEETRRQHDEEINALHAEVRILRQQCNTNMQVLTRKERELAVLRDSLQVEDLNVGYISDDNSEGEDDVVQSASVNISTTDYGPSQAEALATLFSQGGNHSFDSGASGAVRNQIESLKVELARSRAEHEKCLRQLKIEKESLSNAKMIISSLERANKSMMEDLRSRLQDSNSAIASLLEKSIESEKTSSKLRAELAEALQRERERFYDRQSTSQALVVLPIETID